MKYIKDYTVLSLLFVISLFSLSYQDLPVHCLADQIFGSWLFEISTEVFDPSLKDDKTTCGHHFPDRVDASEGDSNPHFKNSHSIQIHLKSDFQIYDDNDERIGKYTMVYDEGMILYIKQRIITVYFKYFKGDDNLFKSDCSKTMRGWHIKDIDEKNKNWSCCFGYKLDKQDSNFLVDTNNQSNGRSKLSSFLNDNLSIDFNEDNSNNLGLLQMNQDYSDRKYEDLTEFINEINNNKAITWKAGINKQFNGMTLAQINSKISKGRTSFKTKSYSAKFHQIKHSYIQLKTNVKSSIKEQMNNPNTIRDADSKDVNSYVEISKYINSKLEDIDASTLPKNWDWRNVGGISFVPKPRQQGDCGSCYVFSTISALESRLRIKTNNKDQTTFSRQFPLSCGIYTEGCDGGYPILLGKFFNEFELIPEDCMEYTQETGNCNDLCDYSKYKTKYFVSQYGYLGGHYGATTEEMMVKELRARGPILGNLAVPWTFTYYKGGIFAHDHALTANSGKLKTTSIMDHNIPWQKVDHSTLIIGYGEENGIKFWICMNTWGQDWGEDGYYRIIRGVDESFIESMGDYVQIGFESRSDFN